MTGTESHLKTTATLSRGSPLNIVHLSTEKGWHGGEEQSRLLAKGLQDRGHGSMFAARVNGKCAQRMVDEEFAVIPLPGRARNPIAIMRLRRALRKWRPHVLHAHDSHAVKLMGAVTLGLRDAPVRICSRRVDFPIRSAWLYRACCDRIIAVSDAVRNVCTASGIPQEMTCVVHDGIDPARVMAGNRARGRQALGLDNGELLVLAVATLTDHKGHTFLLQALPSVLERQPNAVVALVGDGPLAESLKREAKDRGVDRCTKFLGYRNDVPDLMRAADLFVMPSHLEGLGSSVIDAMFARTPIVSTTAGGLAELLGPMANEAEPVAWTVPPRDPSRLCQAIVEAMDCPDEARRRVDRAERRARRYFTNDCMCDRTLETYYDVLEEVLIRRKSTSTYRIRR